MSVAATFEKIHKRKPTDEDLKRIYDIGNALEATENDTFLSLIVALDYYHGIYGAAPHRIQQACEKAASVAAEDAKHKIDVLTAQAVKKASEAVQQAAVASARAASIRDLVAWIVVGFVASAAMVIAMGFFLHTRAYDAGFDSGRAEQRNAELYLQQRDAFVLSHEGKAAYRMYMNGDLTRIINCSASGWRRGEKKNKQDNVCFPDKASDGRLTGWTIP